jgi:hypothetical protein
MSYRKITGGDFYKFNAGAILRKTVVKNDGMIHFDKLTGAEFELLTEYSEFLTRIIKLGRES